VTQTGLLVLGRCAGLVARAPGFSHPSVPMIVRAGLALALALGIAPALHEQHALDLGLLVIALAGEVALGAAMGLGAAVLYDGAYYAGRLVDDAIGVRGSVPTANVTSAQGFGRLWSSAFLAALFLLDGYALVVDALAMSFVHVPPGAFVGPSEWYSFALALPRAIFAAALAVAAPALAVAVAIQTGVAIVSRVVPRMGNFSLSFPIVFAGALIVTLATLPLLAPLGARPWLVLPFGGQP